MSPAITIAVYGLPAPQGSKRHVGKGVMVESSKHVKPWREAVKSAAIEARAPMYWVVLDEPVVVQMVFTMPKPASAPKRRRTWPARMPDLSKLVRSTEDALTDAGIWRDDARVVTCVATKVYPNEHPYSLASPGAVIHIWRIEDAPEVTW